MARMWVAVLCGSALLAAGCSGGSSSPTTGASPTPSYNVVDPGYLLAVKETGNGDPGSELVAAWDRRLAHLQVLCGGPTADIAQVIVIIQRRHQRQFTYEQAAAAWLSTIRTQGRHRDCTAAAAVWTA